MKNKYLRCVLITVLCCIVFFILGEPFRNFLKLSETTEVRPVSAFPLVFGIAFGIWGTLGCAIGNVLADIRCGYSAVIFIPGFFIQILYGYLPVLVFNHLRRNEENKYRLDRVSKLVQFIELSLVDSIFCALMVWTLIHLVYGSPVFGLGFWNTFFNQIIFFIVIGIPSLCFLSVSKQKKELKNIKFSFINFSLNEKIILFFLGFSIVISLLFSIAAYFIFRNYYSEDPMKLWSYIYFSFGISIFVCLTPSLFFLNYMEKNVSTPLEKMSSSAKEFGKEKDIHVEIEKILKKCRKYIYFSTEIGNLARSYNYMANELESYVNNLAKITAEKEKSETQMKIATSIQLGALPKPIELETVDLHATMKPAQEVGGDFYDFFKIDDTHFALVIADVSGKGVPAALFMMVSKIILRKNLMSGLSPAEALCMTNIELCEENPADMFVTCWCGILDLETNLLTFANAGHGKPVVCKMGQESGFVNSKTGFVLGGISGMKYEDETVQLASGDILFTYTDGIPEAINPENEEFGNERLICRLNETKHMELKDICKDVLEAVLKFNETAPQFDDITMLAVRIR